jgi:GNAT superfamily N-acetyltransferase
MERLWHVQARRPDLAHSLAQVVLISIWKIMEDLSSSIREYRPDDAPAVEQCLAELQDFSKLLNPYDADGSIAPQFLLHLLARCDETNGKIFVVESDERVVGMVCIYATVKANRPDEEEYEYAYVSDLVVLAEHRGKGLGRALLKLAEDYAKQQGATLLRITVLAKNEVARKLYIDEDFDELVVTLQKKLG